MPEQVLCLTRVFPYKYFSVEVMNFWANDETFNQKIYQTKEKI